MKNGTVDFYSTVALTIPVLMLAYIFSFRIFDTLKEFASTTFGDRRILLPHGEMTIIFVFVAPVVGIAMAIVGEVACFRALFTGHPTYSDAMWTIRSLETMAAAFAAQLIAIWLIHFQRYYARVYYGPEEPEAAKVEQHSVSSSAGVEQSQNPEESTPQDASILPQFRLAAGVMATALAIGYFLGRRRRL
jgi:hypothetical protein